jgi:carboxypeptidase PM20D1
MAFAKKLVLGGGAVIAIAAAVIAYRTVTFAPTDIASGDDIKLAAIPDFDIGLAANHLGEAIRFQTVSHQEVEENDLTQWGQLHNWLQKTYPAVHQTMVRELVAGNTLIYTWKGSDPALAPIVLMAHQDVVPVTEGTEKDWKHPAFSGEIAGNTVWGRGAVDDKGSLIALFEAVDGLAKSGFKPRRTIYLVSGHDEEAGGTGAKAAADMLGARGVRALFTIDEGSATLLDAPVINGPAALIGIAEKGYATLKVTANADGGHSSMPPKETGVINLAKAVIAINDTSFPLEVRGPGAQMLGSLAAKKGGFAKIAMANLWAFAPLMKKQAGSTPAGAAMLHTTIAPTMLEGSPKENVLPQSASALINYRIAPWNSSADVMARAKSAVGSTPVTLSWVKPPREPSKVSSTNSQGWKFVAAAARADLPQVALAPYLVVAGTDSRSFQDISQDVYRYQPLHFKLSETKMIHGTNEHMTFDNLKRSINFYMRLIATSAG